MLYKFYGTYNGRRISSWVETLDCQVVATTPAFKWMLGKHITEVVKWLLEKLYVITAHETPLPGERKPKLKKIRYNTDLKRIES